MRRSGAFCNFKDASEVTTETHLHLCFWEAAQESEIDRVVDELSR